MSVSGASKIFADILRHYRGYGLSVGTMVAGSDQTVSHLSAWVREFNALKGESLFFVDNEGTRINGELFSVGIFNSL